jgi:hypothetical protein
MRQLLKVRKTHLWIEIRGSAAMGFNFSHFMPIRAILAFSISRSGPSDFLREGDGLG